ncbi:MAG: hypothetical protein IPL41_01180 [Micropruina sp.]|nr:hypothetical protein [Micropruina sp.]
MTVSDGMTVLAEIPAFAGMTVCGWVSTSEASSPSTVSQARPCRRPMTTCGTISRDTAPVWSGSKVNDPNARGPEPATPCTSDSWSSPSTKALHQASASLGPATSVHA